MYCGADVYHIRTSAAFAQKGTASAVPASREWTTYWVQVNTSGFTLPIDFANLMADQKCLLIDVLF